MTLHIPDFTASIPSIALILLSQSAVMHARPQKRAQLLQSLSVQPRHHMAPLMRNDHWISEQLRQHVGVLHRGAMLVACKLYRIMANTYYVGLQPAL